MTLGMNWTTHRIGEARGIARNHLEEEVGPRKEEVQVEDGKGSSRRLVTGTLERSRWARGRIHTTVILSVSHSPVVGGGDAEQLQHGGGEGLKVHPIVQGTQKRKVPEGLMVLRGMDEQIRGCRDSTTALQ